MRYQNLRLPDEAVYIGETPYMNERTVLKGLLNKHMAPRGKIAVLTVKEGSVDFVWESSKKDVITADKDHPIIIEAERYHHVIITGPVEFKVEFYKYNLLREKLDTEADRPGENFIK